MDYSVMFDQIFKKGVARTRTCISKKTYLRYKMRRLQNIARITIQKSKNNLAIFVHFLTFRNFFKVDIKLLRPQTPISMIYSTSSFIWVKKCLL